MSEVYICYSKWNQKEAESITFLLEEKGIECWLVSRDINYAGDWDEQIEAAVRASVISIYLEPADPSFRVLEEVRLIESCNTMLMKFRPAEVSAAEIVTDVLNNIEQARVQKSERERIYPYSGDEPFIFASYSHRDMDKVFSIIRGFQQRGYRVWFDEGIDPGTEWDEYIADHIDKSTYMLAFLSENYFGSSNCRDELAFARDMEKPLLLVYITDDELPPGMKLRLSRLQAIHWYSYDDKTLFYEKAASASGLEQCRGKESVDEN